jgi:hypothetical protein
MTYHKNLDLQNHFRKKGENFMRGEAMLMDGGVEIVSMAHEKKLLISVLTWRNQGRKGCRTK